jgi:hypothetical protein
MLGPVHEIVYNAQILILASSVNSHIMLMVMGLASVISQLVIMFHTDAYINAKKSIFL